MFLYIVLKILSVTLSVYKTCQASNQALYISSSSEIRLKELGTFTGLTILSCLCKCNDDEACHAVVFKETKCGLYEIPFPPNTAFFSGSYYYRTGTALFILKIAVTNHPLCRFKKATENPI